MGALIFCVTMWVDGRVYGKGQGVSIYLFACVYNMPWKRNSYLIVLNLYHHFLPVKTMRNKLLPTKTQVLLLFSLPPHLFTGKQCTIRDNSVQCSSVFSKKNNSAVFNHGSLDFLHGWLCVDEAQGADSDSYVAVLHSQLMLKTPEKAIQGKFGSNVWQSKWWAHFTCKDQQHSYNCFIRTDFWVGLKKFFTHQARKRQPLLIH